MEWMLQVADELDDVVGVLRHGWLGVAAPRDLYKTGGRHGAITNTLYNFHSYKIWAEKIRGSWEDKK